MHFDVDPLTDSVAIGLVQPRSARLWIRAAQSGEVTVLWWPLGDDANRAEMVVTLAPARDYTCSVELPPNADGYAPLTPQTRYYFRVIYTADSHLLGDGSFETAPATPDDTPNHFAIGVMSCHQPFVKEGTLRPEAPQMLRAARKCLRAHGAKFVLTIGDQIYADYPPDRSLFNDEYFAAVGPPGRADIHACSSQEVRTLYQERYRIFYGLPEWQALHAEFPCYPILDDHDIIDNWGSDEAHQNAAWRSVGEGARLAYGDYQAARVSDVAQLPSSFHYDFVYGHTAAFVMDIRSNRSVGALPKLVTDEQIDDLQVFLDRHCDKKVILLVFSVPIVHMPERLARFLAWFMPSRHEFADRWSTLGHVSDRDRVLRLVHDHQQRYPQQQLVFLSGDIHSGCVQKMVWEDTGLPYYQFISSPITNGGNMWLRQLSNMLIRLNNNLRADDRALNCCVERLASVAPGSPNPFAGLNVGIIDVYSTPLDAQAELRFSLYSHEEDEPRLVYQSPTIQTANSEVHVKTP